ncbi:MAG TPA: hypothetical protein VHO47_04870 [Candidatus Babeliales bacterium]|nr:hypothetical protein [Candidatus Babeliales bacterium]
MKNYLFLTALVVSFQFLYFQNGLLTSRDASGLTIALLLFSLHYLAIRKRVAAFNLEIPAIDSIELLEKAFVQKTYFSFPFFFSSSYAGPKSSNIHYFSHYCCPSFVGAHLEMILDPSSKKVSSSKANITFSFPAFCSIVLFSYFTIKLSALL